MTEKELINSIVEILKDCDDRELLYIIYGLLTPQPC